MQSSWLGFVVGAAFCGVIALLFRHHVTRRFRARALLERGGVLVDVDAPEEFVRHDSQGAINIPLEELAMRAHELGPRGTPLVVFAQKFWRGARAAQALRGMGFWEVMNASGLRAVVEPPPPPRSLSGRR